MCVAFGFLVANVSVLPACVLLITVGTDISHPSSGPDTAPNFSLPQLNGDWVSLFKPFLLSFSSLEFSSSQNLHDGFASRAVKKKLNTTSVGCMVEIVLKNGLRANSILSDMVFELR